MQISHFADLKVYQKSCDLAAHFASKLTDADGENHEVEHWAAHGEA